MINGESRYFYNYRHYAKKIAQANKYVINTTFNIFDHSLFGYNQAFIIFDDKLNQTTLEVTTKDGNKHNIDRVFGTPNNKQFIVIINGKPHVINDDGIECAYKSSELLINEEIMLPANFHLFDQYSYYPIFYFIKDGEVNMLNDIACGRDNTVLTLHYAEISNDIPKYDYNGYKLFKVIDENGYERWTTRVRYFKSMPFVAIDDKYYAIGKNKNVCPFEVNDLEGNVHNATYLIIKERSVMFACIDNMFYPIDNNLSLLFDFRYNFIIDNLSSSDIYLIQDKETKKYGYVNSNLEFMDLGCVYETDMNGKPPALLEEYPISYVSSDYPAVFKCGDSVALKYYDYMTNQIRDIIPFGMYSSIIPLEDYIHSFCDTTISNYFIVTNYNSSNEYGIIEVRWFYKNERQYDSKDYQVFSQIIVPIKMSKNEIMNIIDIRQLNPNIPLFSILNSTKTTDNIRLYSDEPVDEQYSLVQNLWDIMQNSDNRWWVDTYNYDGAARFLYHQVYFTKYLMALPYQLYIACEIVFGKDTFEQMIPILDRVFKKKSTNRHGYNIDYPKNGIVDLNELREFINKIIETTYPGSTTITDLPNGKMLCLASGENLV